MAKLILIAVALWLVITVLKRYHKNLETSEKSASTTAAENMVQCAYCGVHLPLSESIESNGRRFCCSAHAHTPDDASGH
jgi:uncharacterized protein